MISRKRTILLMVPVLALGLALQSHVGFAADQAGRVAAFEKGPHPRNENAGPDSTAASTLVETFPDPLGGWTTRWFYLNTNAENYYTASGSNCDPDYRGNQPDGLWISDDRGCNNLNTVSPVRIDFTTGYGDNATSLSLDQFTCITGVTFKVYDKDGNLDASQALPSDCFNWTNYAYPLTNGISAFEWAYTGGQVEGNTSIDNVTLEITPPFAICLKDVLYTTEYSFDIDPGNILRGLAYFPSPDFPAPLTGYYDPGTGTASFTIGYLVSNASRHYFLNNISGLSGYSWGILEDSNFYDNPRTAQLTGCTAAPEAATGESGAPK